MAYFKPEVVDCSIPYKTFNDLKDGDVVFVFDYKKATSKKVLINDYKQTVDSSYFAKNCKKVEFNIEVNGEQFKMYINNGNTFGHRSCYNYGDDIIVVTDERIVEFIIEIINRRNSFQWSAFTSLFGNPMSGYARENIILGNNI